MANEFFVRKGLAIAVAEVATASGATQATKYLVLGNDSIVRWATASSTGGGGTGTAGTSGTSGTRGTSGTSGVNGTNGTSGTSGTRGTSGTSGITPVQGATYQFDSITTVDTVVPPQGGFAYWKEPSINVVDSLDNVQFIQLSKTSLAPESLFLWDWFKTWNGVGTTKSYPTSSPIVYTTSTIIQKGYIRIRSTTDSTYNIFKVVGKGYYNGGGGGPVISDYSATLPTAGDYYLAVIDDQVNNLLSIYVDYVGSIPSGFPTGDEQCFIDFSTSLANLYNQVIVADPKWSFQINDGATPANLASFGGAYRSNSLFLNGYNISISGNLGTSSQNNTMVGFNAGRSITTGAGNTFIGASAGSTNTQGRCNTFVGNYAGRVNTEAFANTFVGQDAGSRNTLASWNTYVGVGAGYNTNRTTAVQSRNTFIGGGAGAGATASCESVVVGYNAGGLGNNLDHVTFVGAYAGSVTATGSNTFVGAYAGTANINGYDNVFLGHDSGANNTTIGLNSGNNNTYVGAGAGFGPTAGYTASFNTMIGSKAGVNNRADDNTFIGAFAGIGNTTGEFNIFIGANTGASNSAGSRNIYIGSNAGAKGVTASCNTFIGYNAGANNLAIGNTFIGNGSGQQNTTGTNNFFMGGGAGNANTVGVGNFFLGWQAGLQSSLCLSSSALAEYNTFIGHEAGKLNKTGCLNTFIGFGSGFNDTTPSASIFIGLYSGENSQNSQQNIYIGQYSGQGPGLGAGQRNVSQRNIFIGRDTGKNKTTGNDNVFIGNLTGRDSGTGFNNTFIGSNVAVSSSYCNTIAIGAFATPTANNQLVIASSTAPIGTASSGVFSHFLNTKINGIDVKIPIYY